MNGDPDALLYQAVQLHRAGRRADAAHLYLAVLRHRGDRADAFHNLGLVAVEGGDLAAGLSQFKAAIAAEPSYGRYWLSYCQALVDGGDLDQARAILPWVLRLRVERGWTGALAARLFGPRPLLAEARRRDQDGRTAEARILVRRVLALDPALDEARVLLAGMAGG